MTPKPTPDDMRLAADWLDSNDGEEAPRCKVVARWLYAQANASELRALCREAGVPVAKAKERLAQH